MDFRISGIDHIVLRVKDMARAERFYCTILGGKVERRNERSGLVQVRLGRNLIDLSPVAAGAELPPPGAGNMAHFALRIDPFDRQALTAHLARHGIDKGRVENRFGAEGRGPSLYIDDPDGNVVELKGPIESA